MIYMWLTGINYYKLRNRGAMGACAPPLFLKVKKVPFLLPSAARQHTILDVQWLSQSLLDPVSRASYVLARILTCVILDVGFPGVEVCLQCEGVLKYAMSFYKEIKCILIEPLNNGLIVPDPGLEHLSIDNLSTVVCVSCCMN
jgi:hypothetical protein